MAILGVLLIIFGMWGAISSIRDRIKDKEKGNDEGVFDSAFIVGGFGLILIGILFLCW